MTSDARLTFKQPAKLGQDAALALEDYARASSSSETSVVLDEAENVVGIEFHSTQTHIASAVTEDIERFFDSLASDAADRLGWS